MDMDYRKIIIYPNDGSMSVWDQDDCVDSGLLNTIIKSGRLIAGGSPADHRQM